jgi:hypothetical protein
MSIWRQHEFLETTGVSGESKSIWRKQEYLDNTRVSGENQILHLNWENVESGDIQIHLYYSIWLSCLGPFGFLVHKDL